MYEKHLSVYSPGSCWFLINFVGNNNSADSFIETLASLFIAAPCFFYNLPQVIFICTVLWGRGLLGFFSLCSGSDTGVLSTRVSTFHVSLGICFSRAVHTLFSVQQRLLEPCIYLIYVRQYTVLSVQYENLVMVLSMLFFCFCQ